MGIEKTMHSAGRVMDTVLEKAGKSHARIILAEPDDRIRKAIEILQRQNIGLKDNFILLDSGYFDRVLGDDPKLAERMTELTRAALQRRENSRARRAGMEKGTEVFPKEVSIEDAHVILRTDPNYVASTLVKLGLADGFVSGNISETAKTIAPAISIIGTEAMQGKDGLASSMFLMEFKDKERVFADCALIQNPTAEQLAHMALDAAAWSQKMGIKGGLTFLAAPDNGPDEEKMLRASAIASREAAARGMPNLVVSRPMSYLDAMHGGFGTIMFPNLNAGNIVYKAARHGRGPSMPERPAMSEPFVERVQVDDAFEIHKIHYNDESRIVVGIRRAEELASDAQMNEAVQRVLASIIIAQAQGIQTPRVAFLSFATGDSAKHEHINKVKRLVDAVRAKAPDMADFLCGPIQYDAALDPFVAGAKRHSFPEVAGKANILICPDVPTSIILLDALRYIGEQPQGADSANAIGPGLLGLKNEVADLSRGGSAEEYAQMIALYLVLADRDK